MSEKRRAGPMSGRAEAKTTLARATAHMVTRNGYGVVLSTNGIIHTHAHCDSHRIFTTSCVTNAITPLRGEGGKYIEREIT
jgi:hypothetical protein